MMVLCTTNNSKSVGTAAEGTDGLEKAMKCQKATRNWDYIRLDMPTTENVELLTKWALFLLD